MSFFSKFYETRVQIAYENFFYFTFPYTLAVARKSKTLECFDQPTGVCGADERRRWGGGNTRQTYRLFRCTYAVSGLALIRAKLSSARAGSTPRVRAAAVLLLDGQYPSAAR